MADIPGPAPRSDGGAGAVAAAGRAVAALTRRLITLGPTGQILATG